MRSNVVQLTIFVAPRVVDGSFVVVKHFMLVGYHGRIISLRLFHLPHGHLVHEAYGDETQCELQNRACPQCGDQIVE